MIRFNIFSLIKYTFAILLIIFVSTSIEAQNKEGKLTLGGNTEMQMKGLPFVNINIYLKGVKISTYKTDRKGRFLLELAYNKNFTIEFTRDSFVRKLFLFNTFMPPELISKNFRFDLRIRLFRVYPNANVIFFDNPMATIYFNKDFMEYDILNPDDANELNEKSLQIERQFLEYCHRKPQFKQEVAEADRLYNNKEYFQARKHYRKAHILIIHEKYPIQKIIELNSIIGKNISPQQMIVIKDSLAHKKDIVENVDEFMNELNQFINEKEFVSKLEIKPIISSETHEQLPNAPIIKGIVYRLQIGSLCNSNKISYYKDRYKIEKPIYIDKIKTTYKYTFGNYRTYSEAKLIYDYFRRLHSDSDVFIIVFKNGKQISLEEAIQYYKTNYNLKL